MFHIDLNCDLGEGMPNDAELMPLVSSANIACGGHAGDNDTMKRTVELALENNVAIGAHPSYPDRENFGRKDLIDTFLLPELLPAMIVSQVGLLQKICAEFGTSIRHIKPHGALYNRAARDPRIAALICEATRTIDPTLILYGLSGSCMSDEAAKAGIVFANEAFADRTYQPDGSLTPRDQPGALIENDQHALEQVMQLIRHGRVTALSGESISVEVQTICLHGDGKHAVNFARMIHDNLKKEEISITYNR